MIFGLARCALAASVAAALLVPAAPVGAVAGFGDVPADAYYTEPVQWMSDTGITLGTAPGCFDPDAPATRAEVAVFIHRMRGRPAGGAEPFVDVGPGDYFADAVAWMAANGVTQGTSPTHYSPYRNVTRGEVATFIHRLAGEPVDGAETFTDVDPSDFFAAGVAWMASAGITTGTSATTFSPDRAVTRAEIATFLYRFAGEPSVNVEPAGVCSTDAFAALLSAEADSLVLLNDLRASVGVGPLSPAVELDQFARAWSESMHASGQFAHSGGPYGENLAWWSRQAATPDEAAAFLHAQWLSSPGHLANMTNDRYTEVGIGFWVGAGGWYVTHVFR